MTKFEQILERMKLMRLSNTDKNEIRNNLLRHMELHPVEERVAAPVRHQVGREGLLTKINAKTTMIFGLIVALLLSGSVSYAAEGSLPGDTLYPIKTEVNEKVRGALAISDESEANLQAKLAVRRLDEAARLAEDNRLSDDVIVELEGRFEDHAHRSKDHIARLEAISKFEAAAKANSDFEAALAAHEMILARFLGDDSASSTSRIGEFVIKVKNESEDRRKDHQRFEIKLRGDISADELNALRASSTAAGAEIKIKTEDDGTVEVEIESESESESHQSGSSSSGDDSQSGRDDDKSDDSLKVDGSVEIDLNSSVGSDDNETSLRGGANTGVQIGL